MDADAAAQLIEDIYKKCKEFEVTPSKFAISIKELIRISDENHIPLNKIDECVDEKIVKQIAEKKDLESEVKDLKNDVSTVKNQKLEIENARDLALQQKKMAELEIKSYTDAKQVLDSYNISINEDLPKFAKTIKCIEKYGDDPRKLVAELEDIQYLDGKKLALEIAIEEFEKRIANLRQQESSLEDKIYAHSENLPIYNQLAEMGFGSSQLKTLLDKIINIAISNGINYCLAVSKFIEDIDTQYNSKVGFDLKIEKLQSEIQNLGKERENELQRVQAQHFVGPVITGLLQRGLTEPDIIKVADRCHNEISNRTSYAEVLRKEAIKFQQNIMMICVVNASLRVHINKQLGMISI